MATREELRRGLVARGYPDARARQVAVAMQGELKGVSANAAVSVAIGRYPVKAAAGEQLPAPPSAAAWAYVGENDAANRSGDPVVPAGVSDAATRYVSAQRSQLERARSRRLPGDSIPLPELP